MCTNKKLFFSFGLLLLLSSAYLSSNLYAQVVTGFTPTGERGSSLLQTLEISYSSTVYYPAFGTTKVTFLEDNRIKWVLKNEWMQGWSKSFHRGRTTIPHDLPAGIYTISVTNGGWGFPLDYGITIDDFKTIVIASNKNTLAVGVQNQELILTLSQSLTNWSKYNVAQVICSNSGVTTTSAQFLSGNQVRIVVNVAPNALLGPVAFYIKYGLIGMQSDLMEPSSLKGPLNPKIPIHYGDYNMIYLSQSSGIISVGTGGPVIINIDPNTIYQGDVNLQLTITGDNFVQGSVVTFNHLGITLVSRAFVSATQLLATINVSANAQLGPVSVTVRNPSGAAYSTSNLLTMMPSQPVITYIDPPTLSQGDVNLRLVITGRRFVQGATLTINYPGVTVLNYLWISSTEIDAWINVTQNAPKGQVTVTIRNPNGLTTSNNQLLKMTGPRPGFVVVEPSALVIGRNFQSLCITGSNFTPDTYIIFYHDAVSILQTTYKNPQQICLLVNVAAGVEPQMIDIAVVKPDGATVRAVNAIYLTDQQLVDRQIELLYPGAPAKGVQFVDESELNLDEIIYTSYPVFRWFSRAQRYKIYIYKPLPGQTSYQEVVNNYPLHQAEVIGDEYWQYPLYAREIEPGIRHFWKVDAYYNTPPSDLSGLDIAAEDIVNQGQTKISIVWSFVVNKPRHPNLQQLELFGTLNPIVKIIIDPRMLEVVAGDRAQAEVRGLDQLGNLAAFIPDLKKLDFREVENHYPEVRILPKSFGTAELVIPIITNNLEFQQRLMRNPAEFARFPIIIKIAPTAKGVGALSVSWQKKVEYAIIKALQPEKAALLEGETDTFRIGNKERLSEMFTIVLEKPYKVDGVISGKGSLLIDSTGFREAGYLPVNLENIRLDSALRAYTGEATFEGKETITLAGFTVEIKKLIIKAGMNGSISGKINLEVNNTTTWIEFEGDIKGTGDMLANSKTDEVIKLAKAEIAKEAGIEIDFSTTSSPSFKKYDPSFRGIILPLSKDGQEMRKAAVSSPEQITSLEPELATSADPTKKLNLDIKNLTEIVDRAPDGIYLSAEKSEKGGINLSWVVTEDGNRIYNIYRRAQDEQTYRLIAERIDAEDYFDLFTDVKQVYWYKVVRLNNDASEVDSSMPVKVE